MLTCMPGAVALVGSGEFLPAMNQVDAGLLAMTGRARPRVAIVPTASFPDGVDVFERWAAMGVDHFGVLIGSRWFHREERDALPIDENFEVMRLL